MELKDLITPERTLFSMREDSKKCVLERVAQLVAKGLKIADCSDTDIFESYVARERLGNTGIGHGVAIPHLRCKKIHKPIGALLHLGNGVDFGAADRQPVDIIFALLVPEDATEEHLKLLSELATLFDKPEFRDKLRNADNPLALHETAMAYFKKVAEE